MTTYPTDVPDPSGTEDDWPVGSFNDSESDGVDALHDAESRAGDEDELGDRFLLDAREAHDLGIELDSLGDDEPVLY